MIIPSQLPQIVTAARSGALQALALQAGQVLDGRVIGPAPNGATQVQIQGQLLNLVLPQAAAAGAALRFEVQGSGAQLRLALQVATARPQAAPGPAVGPSGAPAAGPSDQAAPAPPAPTTPAAPASGAAPAPGSAASSGPPGTPQAMQANPAAASVAPASAAPTSTAAPASSPQAQPGLNQSTPGAGSTPLPPASPASPAPPGTATARPAAPATASPTAAAPPQGTPPAVVPAAVAAPAAQGVPRQAMPYAAAPPATPGASGKQTSGTAGSASTGTRIVSATPLPNVTPAPAGTMTAAMPSTPEAALAQMVQAALPQQNSIVALTTALAGMAGKVVLPEPVARAAQQVLANQLVVDNGKIDASALQRGVLNSGIFQEAALARPGTPLLAPQADMKASLLALRQTLTTWLGQQPALVAAVSQLAPPMRGKTLRMGTPEIPPITPVGGAEEIGKHLLDRTEAALSRIRLHQHASLPDPTLKGADWSTDLPVVIAGHQTLLQLQIHRDEHNPGEEASERGWQMRFAINLPGLGEVGAQVSLRGTATGVMLWASEDSTAAALEADIDGLRDTLAGAGLAPGAVIVRRGAPPASQQPANAGHLVDARR